MTIGELEYDDIITDNIGQKDATTGLPKVPMVGITYAIYAIFLLLMPIILMNLLVSGYHFLQFYWLNFICRSSCRPSSSSVDLHLNMGAKLWNSPPANCKQAACLSTFKQHI